MRCLYYSMSLEDNKLEKVPLISLGALQEQSFLLIFVPGNGMKKCSHIGPISKLVVWTLLVVYTQLLLLVWVDIFTGFLETIL